MSSAWLSRNMGRIQLELLKYASETRRYYVNDADWRNIQIGIIPFVAIEKKREPARVTTLRVREAVPTRRTTWLGPQYHREVVPPAFRPVERVRLQILVTVELLEDQFEMAIEMMHREASRLIARFEDGSYEVKAETP